MVNNPKDVKKEFWKSLLDKAGKINLKLITNKSGIVVFVSQTSSYVFKYDKVNNQWRGAVTGGGDRLSAPYMALDESEWLCMVLTFLNDWCRRK